MKTGKVKLYILYTLLILIIIAVFYSFGDSILDDIYLKKDVAYTISGKISLGSAGKGGTSYEYSFFLKGKWYSGNTYLSLNTDGTKYFIKFYPPNPRRNQATKVIANSDDIKNLPANGYKKLPHQ